MADEGMAFGSQGDPDGPAEVLGSGRTRSAYQGTTGKGRHEQGRPRGSFDRQGLIRVSPGSSNGSAAPGGPRFRSVLIICAANTARSVMAEHLMLRELNTRGARQDVRVRSAGIAPYARDGALVSLDTRMTLRDIGIDIGEEATSTDLKRHPELLE